jgi:putative acetyltransferase
MVATRPEQSGDEAAIRRVNEIAFERADEADLVDALRGSEAWLSEFSIVAEDDSGIVGHALFSLVELDGGVELLSLGPMAVVLDRRRSGVGTALVRDGLERARQTSYPLVVVVGHPDYYSRFGFEPARRFGVDTPYDVPDEAWMALRLPAYGEQKACGTVRYPPAWAVCD